MKNLKTKIKKFNQEHELEIAHMMTIVCGVLGLTLAAVVANQNQVVDVKHIPNDNGRERILTLQKNGRIRSFSRPIKTD